VEMLGDTLREALTPSWISIFRIQEDDLQLVYAAGEMPIADLSTAATDMLLSIREFVQFDRDDDVDPDWARTLIAGGLEIAAPIRRGREGYAIALVSARESESHFGRFHRGFIERVCTECAIAIYGALQTRRLVAGERYAAVGRAGANLAHEMKPIGSIAIGARQILAGIDDRELVQEKAELIQRLANQMRAFLDGMLEDRNTGGQSEADNTIDVVEAVQQAVALVEAEHGRERISVRLPDQVPRVPGSSDLLVGALVNLLENAVLACLGDELVEIVVSVTDNGTRIEVIDSGIGMGSDVVAQAFDPYFTTRDRTRGTGLGLPIARDLIMRLGGRISLSSSESVGTKATVSLPTTPSKSADAVRD